jgi:hypothetical protein
MHLNYILYVNVGYDIEGRVNVGYNREEGAMIESWTTAACAGQTLVYPTKCLCVAPGVCVT